MSGCHWAMPAVVLVAALSALPAVGQQRAPARADKSPRQLWAATTKSPSYGSGAAADIDGDGKPEVVFGTYFNDEHVYALNGEDGSVLWKFKSEGGPVDTSVLLHDVDGNGKVEVIFGDSAKGTLFCLDGAGKPLWKFPGQSGTDSPAAAADLDGDRDTEVVYGTMKTGDGNGRLNVLEGKTGKLKWSVPVPGHVQSEPGLVDLDGDGTLDVLVTTWRGDDRLRALSGRDGHELWHFEIGDWVYHGVSFADFDRDQKPEVAVADRKGHVWLLKGASGAKVWAATLDGERDGSVFGPTSLVDVDRDGVPEIVVPGADLHLLDAKGHVVWRNRYGGASIARGVAVADVDGNGIKDLVFGQGTHLRVVRADTGKELWSEDLRSGKSPHEGIDNAPLVLDLDGDQRLDIFVVTGKGTSDETRPENYGRAVALRAGDGRAAPDNVWLSFRGGSRHGGRPDAPTTKPRGR